jgi:hypothetical protein
MFQRILTEDQFHSFKEKMKTMSKLSFIIVTQCNGPEWRWLKKSNTYDDYLKKRLGFRYAAYKKKLASSKLSAKFPVEAEPSEPANPDYANELEKLADLKAKSIITQADFDAKKKQLLGL